MGILLGKVQKSKIYWLRRIKLDYIIDFILLALIYIIIFRRWKKESKRKFTIKTIMYVYVVMVLFVTLMPFTIPFGGTNKLFMETANFIPFRDVRLKYNGAIREILLNITMMIPFGFLYPIINKKGVIKTVISTFLFSLFIESSQLLSVWWNGVNTRIFDVTDLITNTLGGLIGYIIFFVLKLTFLRSKRRRLD